jgi:GNAT superfamily N-acetyltransferase
MQPQPAGSVRYAIEDIGVLPELLPLAYAHANEITYDITRSDPLDINEETYRALHDAGVLKIFTARSEDRLVGYAVYVLAYSLDRKYILQAQECGLFVLPEFRRGRVALGLLKYADDALAETGCDMVFYHSPAANPKFGELLSRLGYSRVDEVYARRMTCPHPQ